METIDEGKKFLRRNFDKRKPVSCPCCGQVVAKSRRTIYGSMAKWLIELVLKSVEARNGYVEVRNLRSKGGDYAKLRFWGLVEQKPNRDPKKKESGIWRPTEEGRKFAFRTLKVPRAVFIFNNTFQGYEDPKDLVDIAECLGEQFDYSQLMQSSYWE